jgi:hypothetical protein
MMRTLSQLLIAFFLVLSIAVFGCTKTVRHKPAPVPPVYAKQPGPPPHAPAHGYRHKHPDGVVLVYQSNIGVYVASGHRDVYFHKDRYYRVRNGSWQISVHVEGPWKAIAPQKVPLGLQKKSHDAGSAKGKDKKHKKKGG